MFYAFHECPLIRYCRTKKPGRGNFHFVNDLNAEVLGILMAAGSEKKTTRNVLEQQPRMARLTFLLIVGV